MCRAPTQTAERDVEVTAIATQLDRIAQTTEASTALARRALDETDFERDNSTHVRGATVRCLRGHELVVVDLTVMGRLTIDQLARVFRLPPEQIWRAISRWPNNRPVLAAMWREEFDGETYPGHARARRQLEEAGESVVRTERGPLGPSLYHAVDVYTNRSLTLPMSGAFRREILADRARARAHALSPVEGALRTSIDSLVAWTNTLRSAQESLRRHLARPSRDVARIASLRSLLLTLLTYPKPSYVDSGEQARLRELADKMERLEKLATERLAGPSAPGLAEAFKEERQLAVGLLERLDAPRLIAHTSQLRDHPRHFGIKLVKDLCGAVGDAVTALLVSPSHGETAYERYYPTLVGALAPSPGAEITRTTVVDHLAALIPEIVETADDDRGPSFMSADILATGAPIYLQESMTPPSSHATPDALDRAERPGPGAHAAARAQALNRAALAIVSHIDRRLAADLAHAAADRSFVKVDDVLGGKLRGWRLAGPILATLNIAVLIYSLRDGIDATLEEWVARTSAAGGFMSSVSLGLRHARWARDIALMPRLGSLASVLGRVLGGVAAVGVGAVSAIAVMRDLETQDTGGVVLNVLGVGGAALTLAGLMVSAGAGASATGVGSPLGGTLILAGAITGATAAVWLQVREWLTAGSHLVFEAYFDYLDDPESDGELWELHALVERGVARDEAARELVTLYRRLQREHRDVEFWPAEPADEVLIGLHLAVTVEHLAMIVDEDEDVVRDRLQELTATTVSTS